MIISVVTLKGTFVNRFSTSSEAYIPLLGLIVCRTWINLSVDSMIYSLGMPRVISWFIVFVSS